MTTPQLFNLITVHWLSVLNCLEKNMKAQLTATGNSLQHKLTCVNTSQLFNLMSVHLLYQKIVKPLVFAWTNIVTHLLQEFCFSQNLSAIIIFQNRSQDSTLISVLLNAFLTVSLICIFLLFETYRVTTTNISPDDKSTSRVLLIL